MNISVEGFAALQGLSCACALWALTRQAGRSRIPLRCILTAGAAGGVAATLCMLIGGSASRLIGAAVLLLLLPRAVLPALPAKHALRLRFAFAGISLLAGGTARACIGMGCSPSLAVLIGCAALLLLPRMQTAPLDVTKVEIRRGRRSATLSAMVDSGNLLRDAVTGLPVIVCSPKALAELLPPMQAGELPSGFRYLSARTASGAALLPCFRPDRVRLRTARGYEDAEALVALAVNGYNGFQALVPASLTQCGTPRPPAAAKETLT